MGMLDQNTVDAKEAMKQLFDPMNNLPTEVKAQGLEAINKALVTGASPMAAYEQTVKDAAMGMSDLVDRHEIDMPRALAILKGASDEQTPGVVSNIQAMGDEFQTVEDKITTMTTTDIPAIVDATAETLKENTSQTTALAQNWQNVLSKLWEVHGEIDNITRAIQNMPTSKTVTINVVQTGGIGAQHGLDFIVPSGFPHDTFPMNVSSGERVVVTPTGMESQRHIPRTITQTVNSGNDNAEIARSLNMLHGALRQIPTMIGRSMRDNLRQVL